jgi:hypothetical protein
MAMAELSYDPEASDPAWAITVASWPWKKQDRWSWTMAGPCPRCGHPTELEIPVVVGFDSADLTGDGGGGFVAPALPARVDFRCLCDHVHADGKVGCGLLIEDVPGPGRV